MKIFSLIVLTLTLLSAPTMAAEVSMRLEKQSPVINFNPEGKEFAVFQRFNDVWLVFNSEIKSALPASLIAEPAIGLSSQEKLTVSGGGSGIRLSFKENKPFYIKKDGNNFSLKIGNHPTPKQKAILNIVSLQEGIHLSGKNISTFLEARSIQTGERYTVMPMNILNGQQQEASFYPIKFLQTLSGRAFTSSNGKLIDVLPQNGEYLIFTSPKHKIKVNKFTGNRAVLNEIEEGVPVNFRDPEFLEMFATGIDGTTKKAQMSFAGTLSLLTEAITNVEKLPTPQDGKSLYDKQKFLAEMEARIAKNAPIAIAKAPIALPDGDILLPRYTKVGEKDFRRFERKFLKRLLGIKTEEELNKGRLQLAKLAFAFKRYEEAGALLRKIPEDEQNKSVLAQTRILRGAANILINRSAEALPLLMEGENLEADRLVWLAYAYEKQGNFKKAAKLFKENADASRAYPPHLQIKIRLSEARTLLAEEKITELEKRVFDMERLVTNGDIPAEAKLLLAKGYMLKKKYEEAEKLLSEVAQSNNPEAAFMAQYDFVIHLLDHGELTKKRALAHLEDLRFLWRGGQLEEDILYRLGTMYLNQEDYRKGLDRFKYYTIYFSDSPLLEDIAHKMTNSFNDIFFNEQAISEKDPLEILGLYYDFRELTPPGERGDQLIARIGDKLRGLGLFDRASKLLKHQLNFRTKSSVEKAKLGKQLAELYLLNLKYKKGLDILEKTESKHIPNEVVQQRILVKSRLLMAKGDTSGAHKILMSLVAHKAKKLTADLAWAEKKYDVFIPIAEKILKKQSTPEKWVAEDHTNFARLVFAYGETKNMAKIAGLEKKYPIYVDQENITQILTFLKQDESHINVDNYKNKNTNWAKIIQHMDTYNNFSDQYQQYKEAREKEKKSRKYYNKRMGQPSAPSRL